MSLGTKLVLLSFPKWRVSETLGGGFWNVRELYLNWDSKSEFEVTISVLLIYMKILLQVKTSSYFGSLNLYEEEVALQIEFLFYSFWRSLQWDSEGDSVVM